MFEHVPLCVFKSLCQELHVRGFFQNAGVFIVGVGSDWLGF